MPDPDRPVDFFVSHADVDLEWAEWIAAELEGAGYGVIVKAWDFRPGDNIVTRHDEALASCRHTICVLSENYLVSEAAARTAAQYQDLTGKDRALIPVKVADCDAPPLLAPTIAIDLSITEDADEARRLLLAGVGERAERVARRSFPGARAAKLRFPGRPAEIWDLRGQRADPFFTGRDDELASLHRALRAGHPASAVQVITGLGGQGKTALAVEYAFRHAGAYDLVWWVRAEDPATLRGDFVELAAELGLPTEKDDHAITVLRRELRNRRDWLLIFDNAEDPGKLFRLLPDRHSGHVLVTSRRRDWSRAETRDLDVLPVQAAADYLRRKGQVAGSGRTDDLAEALGCLPLALVQAASAIAEGIGADEYLGLIRQQSAKVFAEGQVSERDVTIATTWRVSVDRLAVRSAAAVALFRLSAFLAADAIPLTRLTAVDGMPAELASALTDPLQRRQATAALGEYSLARTAGGLLSIHRLVQAVTRAELGDDARHWAGMAVAVIAAAFPGDEKDPACWERCEELLTHALTCADHAVGLQVDTIATTELLNRVARYLLARSRLGPAKAVLDQAFTAGVALDHENPAYLSCRNTYGKYLLLHGDKGEQTTAVAVQKEVYEARIRTLGVEHPDTLRAGRDYVEALHREGRRAEAAALHEQLTESFRAVLGPDHLETITALAYRATILHDAGEYGQARVLEEQVVKARTEKLGEDHADTLLAWSNLAETIREMGELNKAQAITEQVLATSIKALGEDSLAVLVARTDLAGMLLEQGYRDQAIALLTKCLETASQLLGIKDTFVTEAAWQLVEGCLPHETARRQMLITRYLAWLKQANPGQLTDRQKEIRDSLGGRRRPETQKKKKRR